MSNFVTFGKAVKNRFGELSQEDLFVVNNDRDEIWTHYLNSFPAGSNPIFRKNTEHDCSCCRNFIRNVGNVVAIQNGVISTVWDLNGLPEHYQVVADSMAKYIRSLSINNIFLTEFNRFGEEVSHQKVDDQVFTFEHFFSKIPNNFVSKKGDEKRGVARTTFEVLLRGFTELTTDAVATVSGLIEDEILYKGQEFKDKVNEFKALQERFLALSNKKKRECFVWTLVNNPVARFRNTVIGTLIQDLSEGVDLEKAVGLYESKVAPLNYHRTTALITKSMIANAMKTIKELDLEDALVRRHARLSDVNINSVLFVDNTVAGKMKGGIEDLLSAEIKPEKVDLSRAIEIEIDDFNKSVLSRSKKIDLYLENKHAANFVSLTAPVHEDVQPLFRWSNNFAWSYEGNVTDSIKDKVKKAGGMVEGVALRVSLSWNNVDDLDLHVYEPNGNHIYFNNKGLPHLNEGCLDVDMNVANPVRNPVENIRWKKIIQDGVYSVFVHNYTRRESIDVGFTVEIESSLGINTFNFSRALPNKEHQQVVEILVKKGQVVEIISKPGIVAGIINREIWGLKTHNLVRVNSIVLSPNHWKEPGVGSKHWFFILEGCKNPNPTRGIYNEFLSPKLLEHRKVFEILGDKTKCPVVDDQLSGVGFSASRNDTVSVVAMGPKFNRAYTIAF
jgi:hypothetical protein